MKVKVSYTVDLERVPDLIAEILHECCSSMGAHSKELKFLPHDHGKTLRAIQAAREAMASVDESLQEASHLIAGWHSTVNPSAPELPPPPAEEEHEYNDEKN
jgi:hypothetical protein